MAISPRSLNLSAPPPETVNHLLKEARAALTAHSTTPELDGLLLLSLVTKRSKENLLANPLSVISPVQTQRFQALLARRSQDTPLAYLRGTQEFYGRSFLVNRSVLIPRPETEGLVEQALKEVTGHQSLVTSLTGNTPFSSTRGSTPGVGIRIFTSGVEERVFPSETEETTRQLTIIDLGTGSGNIIITLAKELESIVHPQSSINLIATDISKKALRMAKQNAFRHGVAHRITFLHGSLLDPLLNDSSLVARDSSLILLANLPYLDHQWMTDSGLRFEPSVALDGGSSGLKLYRQLFSQLHQLVVTGCGLTVHLYVEIDPRQKESIRKLAQNFGLTVTKITPDLAQHPRIVQLTP